MYSVKHFFDYTGKKIWVNGIEQIVGRIAETRKRVKKTDFQMKA